MRDCRGCKHFMPDKDFQKSSWFGLRKNVETHNSLFFAKCGRNDSYTSTQREVFGDCKPEGIHWEPKDG